MKIKIAAIAIATLAIGAGLAYADSALKEQREAMMKKNGAAMGEMAKIAKGQAAYDVEVIKASLATIAQVGKDYPALFPAADAVVDPEASPKIWENMDDFNAKSAKMTADAEALMASPPADAAAVGAALGTLGQSCQSCHEAYRIKS